MPDRFRGAPKGLARTPGSAGNHPAPPTVLGQLLRPIRPTVIQPARPRPNRKREDQIRRDQHLQLIVGAMEAAADGLMITSTEGVIVWANEALARMTGYRLDELVGAPPRILKSGRHDASFYAGLWNTILSGGIWHGRLVNRRRDGSLYSEEMTIAPIRDHCSVLSHFVAVKRDLSAWMDARHSGDDTLAHATRQATADLADQLTDAVDPSAAPARGPG